MGVRVDSPEAMTAASGQVFLLAYHRPITVEIDQERFRPIDVQCSEWACTVEADGAIRLGLRYVSGLRQETGHRIAEEALADWR